MRDHDHLDYAVSFLLAAAAVSGILHTMHATVGARAEEIAILRTVGFGGFAVAVAIVAEVMLFALRLRCERHGWRSLMHLAGSSLSRSCEGPVQGRQLSVPRGRADHVPSFALSSKASFAAATARTAQGLRSFA